MFFVMACGTVFTKHRTKDAAIKMRNKLADEMPEYSFLICRLDSPNHWDKGCTPDEKYVIEYVW